MSEKTIDGPDGADTKVEPYVGHGEVDLAESEGSSPISPHDDSTHMGMSSTGTRGSRSVVGELERETKVMLGVQSATTSTNPRPNTTISPIPTKSTLGNSPTTVNTSTPQTTSTPHTEALQSPGSTHQHQPATAAGSEHPVPPAHTVETGRDSEVEYVRHTDGGGMRVELPPLYTDVPPREGER